MFARKSRNFSDASGREVDYGSKLISKSIRAKVKYVLSPKWCNVVQLVVQMVLNFHLDLFMRNSRREIVFGTPCSKRNTCGNPCKEVQVFTTERL